MPIGLTVGTPRDVAAVVAAIKQATGHPGSLTMPMVGVNCAACHVGRLRYKNKDLPLIEGAPNLFNIDAFYQELFQSAAETVKDQGKLEAFLNELGKPGAKSDLSKILLTSFDRYKKNRSQVLSPSEKKENPLEVAPTSRPLCYPSSSSCFGELGNAMTTAKPMSRFHEDSGLLLHRYEFLKTLETLHTAGQQD